MNKFLITVTVLFVCASVQLNAQDPEQINIHSEVTSSLGKQFTADGLTMTLTVGEPIVGKAVAAPDSPALLQGFQPTIPSFLTSIIDIQRIDFDLGIHPNPSTEYVIITLSDALDAEHLLSMYSETGRLIAEWQMMEGLHQRQIDLPALSPGLYHFQLSDKQAKPIASKQIILN